ncbi:MAG TPA: hypothetical protein VH253_05165 [Phycisphaerae bacterium]|nr:hypothetical protein [Phycisphaerae bacterium]
MKMAVIGLAVVLGAAGVAIGQEGAAAVGGAATQGGVKMEQGHPWPVNDKEATKEQLQAKGKWLREQVRGSAGGGQTDVDVLKKRIDALSTRSDEITLELSEKRARRDAVARKITELTDQAKVQAGKDPIAQELEKSAAARDRAAEQLEQRVKVGTVTEADAEAAVAEAADAHVKLEERREAVTGSVGGGILPELNRELVALSIDEEVEQKEARAVSELRQQLEGALEVVNELENVEQLLILKYQAKIDG